MKIVFNREVLIKKLFIVNCVSPNKILPASFETAVDINDGYVTFHKSNTENFVSVKCEYDSISKDQESFVMNSTILQGLIAKLASETITLEVLPGEVVIKTEKSKKRYSIPILMERKDYLSKAPSNEVVGSVTLRADVFCDAYTRNSKFSSSQDDISKFYGVKLFKDEEGVLWFLSTDKIRLCISKLSSQFTSEGKIDVLLNSNIEPLLNNFKGLNDLKVNILKSGNVLLEADGVELMSKTIDIKYPDIISLRSNFKYQKSVVIDRLDLIEAIDRLSFVKDENFMTIFELNEPEKLVVSCEDNLLKKSGTEEFDVYDNSVLDSFALNGKFAVSVLRAMRSEKVNIEFIDYRTAILFTERMESTDVNVEFMISPMDHTKYKKD